MSADEGRAALVLTGGGARAAYQVGVLAAVRELRGKRPGNPFPILCGTSAGAINAVALAVHAGDFGRAVRHIQRVWRSLHVDQVYRVDPLTLFGSGLRWGAALFGGWLVRQTPRSLLDNTPLRGLLERVLDFPAIEAAIGRGDLRALSVTASGYSSGESLAFFQGAPELQPWRRAQRLGVRAELDVCHVLASAALPFVFPAVKIHREYFGDGSMRQLAPVSPAIHLGADRILVIGAGRTAEEGRVRAAGGYPSPAQIAGHALSSIFLDSMSVDLERMSRINRTLSLIPESSRAEKATTLRPIEVLVIAPSQRLDHLAARHAQALPWPVRTLLRGIGAMNANGGALTSYLLFEESFTRALIELGHRDTMERADEVSEFLVQ